MKAIEEIFIEAIMPHPLTSEASALLRATDANPICETTRCACADALRECGNEFLATLQEFEVVKIRMMRELIRSLAVPTHILQGKS